MSDVRRIMLYGGGIFNHYQAALSKAKNIPGPQGQCLTIYCFIRLQNYKDAAIALDNLALDRIPLTVECDHTEFLLRLLAAILPLEANGVCPLSVAGPPPEFHLHGISDALEPLYTFLELVRPFKNASPTWESRFSLLVRVLAFALTALGLYKNAAKLVSAELGQELSALLVLGRIKLDEGNIEGAAYYWGVAECLADSDQGPVDASFANLDGILKMANEDYQGAQTHFNATVAAGVSQGGLVYANNAALALLKNECGVYPGIRQLGAELEVALRGYAESRYSVNGLHAAMSNASTAFEFSGTDMQINLREPNKHTT